MMMILADHHAMINTGPMIDPVRGWLNTLAHLRSLVVHGRVWYHRISRFYVGDSLIGSERRDVVSIVAL